jgi:transposase
MARYKHYDYDQMMLVPVLLENQLMPGTLEYPIHHVVEERLDLSFFEGRYCNDETGRKAIDPKALIKIVLFGYSRGLISSRTLERACKENITFMALSCGQQPDHSTLAAFVSSLDKINRLRSCSRRYCWFAKKRVCLVARISVWTD